MADVQSAGIPVPPPVGQPPVFSVGLYNLRRQIGKEATVCWLLVALVALASWTFGPIIFAVVEVLIQAFSNVFWTGISSGDSLSAFDSMFMGESSGFVAYGYLGGVIFPILVVVWAQSLFKNSKERTIKDLAIGNMALMLIDEQYGIQIQEAVQSKYRLVLGKVPLTGDLAGKVNHFAYYYKYYYRQSFGPSELNVATISAESCWLEGCAIAACYSCPFLLVALVLRVVLVRPRVLGIKTAVLEYLEGRYDHLLEQQTAI